MYWFTINRKLNRLAHSHVEHVERVQRVVRMDAIISGVYTSLVCQETQLVSELYLVSEIGGNAASQHSIHLWHS